MYFLELELMLNVFFLMDFIFNNEKGFLFVFDYNSNGINGENGGIIVYLFMFNIYWKEVKELFKKKKILLMLKLN